MKRYSAIILTLFVLFVIAFRFVAEIEKRQVIFDSSIQKEAKDQKNLRKVSYGEGEYEKVKAKWAKESSFLFLETSKNMQEGFEQIAIQNFVQLAKRYNENKTEIEKVDPPEPERRIHTNLLKEFTAGRELCLSYISDYKQYDHFFRIYYSLHFQNQKVMFPGT